MSEKAQFPKWKIGILSIWMLLAASTIFASETPALKENSNPRVYSEFAEPQIVGPDGLCNIFGTVVGTYSAGGDIGDVYEWTVFDPSGNVILSRNGGEQLETIQVVFPENGDYSIHLRVRRGTNSSYYEETKPVSVEEGPELALLPDYLLCAGSYALLTALDPEMPNLSDYTIEWKDIEGNLLGTGNELMTYSEGFHLVELYQTNAAGGQSCLITGSTFVGPPIDFKITTSSSTICEGESISVGLDTPLSGEWFIQKDFTGARRSLGNAFDIQIPSSELAGPGLYIVSFQTTTEDYPDCISERIVGFELLESPQISIQNTIEPDPCLANGSFEIAFQNDIDGFSIPELNITGGPQVAGQSFPISNLETGVYTIFLEKNGCETTSLLVLDSSNSGGSTSPSTIISPETCSPTGVAPGSIEVDLGTSFTSGTYRVLSTRQGEIETGAIPASGEFVVNLNQGSYFLELEVDGCTYPIIPFEIENAPQVEYTIPTNLNICESFIFQPDTDQNLRFTLTYPDGQNQSINAGQSFTLTEAGPYSIYGESRDGNTSLCPKVIDFTATFSSSISFAPVLAIEKCFDPIKYIIDLNGITIEEASIRWLNDQGEIVGRSPEFYPRGVGLYSLVVQPLESGYCPVVPVEFEVEPQITSVPMDLTSTKICPDPGLGLVTLSTNEEEVVDTEWIYYDSQDNREELVQFDGLFEIEIDRPGTYEAVAYNSLGCEIGRNLVAVENSSLLTPPLLEDSYAICSKENTLSGIDPGEFATYEWYFGEQLVSTSRVYKPTQVGEYFLVVTTIDGCEFSGSFTTYDACDFEVVFPNAMIAGDPARNFQVILSEGVTEASLFILNRQGALIYQTDSVEIAPEAPVLQWDGTMLDGKKVPVGTYVVVLMAKNPTYGFEEKITGSLLVIE